jgi:hypothetical protein
MLPSLLRKEKQRKKRLDAKTPTKPLYSPPNLNTLEKFIDFLVAELFPKTGQYIAQFTSSNVAIAFLVKHLETTNELL